MEEAGHDQSSVVYYCPAIADDIYELFYAVAPPSAVAQESRQPVLILDRIYKNVCKLLDEHQGDFDKVCVSSNLDKCREHLKQFADSRPTAVLVELSDETTVETKKDALEFLRSLSAAANDSQYRQAVMPFVLLATDLALDSTQARDPILEIDFQNAGAIDSMRSPMCSEAINDLVGHVKEATRPSARTLGVGMARRLVNSIASNTKPGVASHRPDEALSAQRKSAVEDALAKWQFSAHELDTDELTYGAMIMLERVLQNPELESFRLQRAELMTFLLAARREYKHEREVHYHNWRHAVDVTQSIFCFLCNVRLCPPPTTSLPTGRETNALERILSPRDALILIISAIGHDVGHPGVNNAFLVASNHELAQMYNDKSVLENYHCAAYSQLLRLHWPALFNIPHFRTTMISTILATDMQRHFEYMGYLNELKQKFESSHHDTSGWSDKERENTRDLIMALLIKAADISNVARPFDVSAQWATVLMNEFSRQGELESELQIPTCLFGGPPNKEDVLAAAQSQKGFMNLFGVPLFSGISEVMPNVSCTISELENNKEIWERRIANEKSLRQSLGDGTQSPRTYGSVTETQVEEARLRKRESEPTVVPLAVPQSPTESSSRQPGIDRGGSPVRHPASELRNFKQLGLAPNATAEKRASSPQLLPSSIQLSPTGGSSRRSSKDVALGQLQELSVRAHHNLAPTPDSRRASADAGWQVHQNYPGSRRGSKEESLTTILVTSQGSPGTRNVATAPQATRAKQSRTPVPSSTLQTTGSATAITADAHDSATEPSFTALSDDQKVSVDVTPSSDTHTGYSEPTSRSGAWPMGSDVSRDPSATDTLPSTPPELSTIHKVSESPHIMARMTSGESAASQSEVGRSAPRTMHQSRSRSRLRGLKFWRKRREESGIGISSPDLTPPSI